MTIKIKRYFFIVILSFVYSFKSSAQENTNVLPLIEILNALESQYRIQFNYAEDIITEIVLLPPKKQLKLEDVLSYLEDSTNLIFSLTNTGTVLIIANKNQPIQELSEILVSSYIVKGINKLNDGSFEIDISDFDILPGLVDADVLQSIQAFPGIQSINETVSNINIRAGTHDQNLILWDDIKMYQSGHFFGLISMFNPQITQQVSLIKNGATVDRTDGVSGTIVMETEKETSKEFNGNLGVNFTDANGFVDVPLGKSSLQIAARKSISDLTQTPTYDNFFERIAQDTELESNTNSIINSDKQFDFYDMSLRWIYNISDNDELRINFINVANQLIFNENTMTNSRESSLKQNSIAGAIQYSRSWNAKWQTIFEAYETDYQLKSINSNILDSQRFLQENKVSETSLKLKANYKITNRLSLLSGYHFVETGITNLDDVDNPIFRSLVSEVVRTHGVFSQLFYKSKNKHTSLNIGLRYNYIDKFSKHILEPRLSFSHKFLDYFSFEILGAYKHQNTSQVINFQNDFLGIEKRRWQLSNDSEIPVIRSRQVSMGITFNQRGWLVSTEAYYKKVSGITTQSQGFQNQYEFIKTNGEYDVRGIDFIVRKQIERLSSWLSYSYMNSNYIFKSLPEYTFPSNLDITHALTFGTNYTFDRLKVSVGLNWNSGKPNTNPVTGNEIVDNDINYEATNTSQLQDYFRVDISALYNFKLGSNTKANIGVSVWNVFDQKNAINNFYRFNGTTINETEQQSLDFTPNVTFKVYF
ncbi:TonB-dependent siderophore receptor [uncultured Psychroserpens sp.]|uniref:TonB-dependent receptor plug domain-containing protein n=1 Tax=uncultured Psychroserpens sp. TaxID=255436 RepID=UPI00260D1C25|nr:TonB-dependent receptor plug domain-containing protein [uncultured Psychroserpens sp.]